MKEFLSLFLVIVIIYNLNKRKNNLYKSELPKSSIYLSITLLIIGVILWYLYDKSILGFTIAINSAIFFMSFFLAIGIGRDFFNVFMSNAIVIKKIPFEKVNIVYIIEHKDRLLVKINAFGNNFTQSYNLSNKDEIILHLNKNLGNKIILENFFK